MCVCVCHTLWIHTQTCNYVSYQYVFVAWEGATTHGLHRHHSGAPLQMMHQAGPISAASGLRMAGTRCSALRLLALDSMIQSRCLRAQLRKKRERIEHAMCQRVAANGRPTACSPTGCSRVRAGFLRAQLREKREKNERSAGAAAGHLRERRPRVLWGHILALLLTSKACIDLTAPVHRYRLSHAEGRRVKLVCKATRGYAGGPARPALVGARPHEPVEHRHVPAYHPC